MAQKRRRAGRRSSADNRIKYIRLAAIPVILVVVLAVIILVMDKKPGKEEGVQEAALSSGVSQGLEDGSAALGGTMEAADQEDGADGQIAPDNSQYTTDFSQYELRKDEIPQVNQLISEYFQAKVDQNAEELFRIFGKTGDIGLEELREELQAEAVFIEDYVDIVCYTKPGLAEDSYIAYVTYEAKFRRVDTLAPGLLWCYVVKAEDGSYIIREHVVGDEADYVAKQNQSEDVMLLSSQVNERLRQAIEQDTLLAGIYQNLKNGAVVPTSEAEEGGDSTVMIEEESQESVSGSQPAADTKDSPASPQSDLERADEGAQEADFGAGEASEAVQASESQEGSSAPSESAGGSSVKIES